MAKYDYFRFFLVVFVCALLNFKYSISYYSDSMSDNCVLIRKLDTPGVVHKIMPTISFDTVIVDVWNSLNLLSLARFTS